MEKHRNRAIWDCDSALYDSFELKSFKRQLDSVIADRTLSMSRLSEPTVRPAAAAQAPKKRSKAARTLNKFLRSVFRLKPPSGDAGHGFYAVYPQSNSLAAIPEVSEKALDSPEFESIVRKTASERFTSTAGRNAEDPDVFIRF